MRGRRVDPCAVHWASLLEFVDGGDRSGMTAAALDHLDACSKCRDDLTEIALAVRVLRHMGRELATVEPPENGWTTLRARLRRRRRPAVMSPIAGMALGMALVAVIVGPYEMTSAPTGPIPTAAAETATDPWLLEERFVTAGRNGPQAARVTIRLDGTTRNYPDGIHPPKKEVTMARVIGRPVTPS